VIHVDFEVHGSRTILRLSHELPALDVHADEQPADYADEGADDAREQETDIRHSVCLLPPDSMEPESPLSFSAAADQHKAVIGTGPTLHIMVLIRSTTRTASRVGEFK
jgi:hypothetical protein